VTMVFPSTVPTVVMPSALVAVTVVIAVSVAIHWSRRVDHRGRRLIHDRGWCDVHGPGNAQKNADVRVSESRARSTGSGNSHCDKKSSAIHGVVLCCRVLAGARQRPTTQIVGLPGRGRCSRIVSSVTGSNRKGPTCSGC
jgi:hypothetical protein